MMRGKGFSVRSRVIPITLFVAAMLYGGTAVAQTLNFFDYRDKERPEYATIMLGPFYSDVVLSQSVGWQWSHSRGADLTSNERSSTGSFKKDGSDFPITTSLSFRNYLLLSRSADMEMNVSLRYKYFPLGTQDDEFNIDFSDEGIYGGLSSEFELSPVSRLRLYDNFAYYTDWVDLRGISDPYGGENYQRIVNTIGSDYSWLASKLDSVNIGLSRYDEVPVGGSGQFDVQKHHTYREGIGWQHRQTSYFIWSVGADQTQNFYTDPDRDESTYKWDLYYGVNLRVTEHININTRFGYQIWRVDGTNTTTATKGSGLGFDLETGSPLTQRLSQTIELKRSLSTAFQGGVSVDDTASYQINWDKVLFPGNVFVRYRSSSPQVDGLWNKYADLSFGTKLSIPVTRYIKVAFGSSYTTRLNSDPPLAAPADTEAETDPQTTTDYGTWVTDLSTTLQLRRALSLSLYGQHIERISDDDALAYTRDVVGANLNWSYRF